MSALWDNSRSPRTDEIGIERSRICRRVCSTSIPAIFTTQGDGRRSERKNGKRRKKRGIKTNGARAADVVPRAVDPVRRRGKP